MPTGTYTADIFGRPGAGLADGWRPAQLREDEWSFAQNMKPYLGTWVKRGGTVLQGASLGSATVTWLFHAYGTDTSAALVVRLAMCGTKLRYKIGAGAWTDLKTGLTAGTFPVAVQWKEHVYWCDGTNTPQDITIASPPTITDWVTMPSGINPSWVVLHLQKLKIGGDKETGSQYWMTEFGLPNTFLSTSFYLQPDDQNGNYPKVAITCNRRVGLFCQDFLVAHSGAGPNSDQFYPMPRGAACTARRSVVDMGEFGAFYLSARGLMNWDLNSPPEPIDPFGRINVGDIDYTTEDSIWAARVGDEYRLYFTSKGNTETSSASAASITAASVTRTSFSPFYVYRNTLTASAFVVGGNTPAGQPNNYYYSYDCRMKVFSGPHTGGHACGAWEQYRYGDTQTLWVGDNSTGGKVWKADQRSVFTDDTTIPIVGILRTGSIGNRSRLRKTKVNRITFETGVIDAMAQAGLRVSIFQNGRYSEPPVATFDCTVGRKSVMGIQNTQNDVIDCENFVVIEAVPEYSQPCGYQPQMEIQHSGQSSFQLCSYEIDFESES